MEFLRRISKQIQAQLGTLSVSGKLAIGLGLVLMVGAIIWMTQYASAQEMTPILPQSFTPEDISKVTGQLDSWGVKYEVEGDKVMVPKTEQRLLVARLASQEMLPKDISIGFTLMLSDSDIWMPETQRADKRRIILQKELARTLVEGWENIEKAEVFINEAGARRIDSLTPPASASVMIKLQPGELGNRKLARSVANFVSAANARMRPEDVKVIINGQGVAVGGAGEEMGGDYLEMKVKYENLYREKIQAVVPAGSLVQVDVRPRSTKKIVTDLQIPVEDKGSWLPTIDATSNESKTNPSGNGGVGGVEANSIGANTPVAAVNSQDTTEQNSATKQPFPGKKETKEEIGLIGLEEDRTCTVSIPREYFETVAQRELGKKPDESALKTIIDRDLPSYKQNVMGAFGIIGPEAENQVVVNTFWGGGVAAEKQDAAPDTAQATQAAGSIAGMTRTYGKHIAVSALALFSLMMVLMMVKKASGPVDLTEDEAQVIMGKIPASALSIEESNLPEGEEAKGVLAGMEMEEEEVRTQQIMDQIKEMVKDQPEVAATLVGKWIEQSI